MKKEYFIWGGLLILLLVIFWKPAKAFLSFKLKKSESTSTGNGIIEPKSVKSGFPLKKGSKGADVLRLQKALNKKLQIPRIPLVEDGSFGKKTEDELLVQYSIKVVEDETRLKQIENISTWTPNM